MLLCSAAWIDKECPGEEKEAFWDTAAESGPAIVGPSQDSYGRFCWVDWLWSDKCLSDQSQQSVEWVYGVCDQFVMNLNNAVCVCIDWLIDWLIDWSVNRLNIWWHERVSETGVFPSLDRVCGTLCLLHYVTETSHFIQFKRLLKTLLFV